jgi:predicted RNA methylase
VAEGYDAHYSSFTHKRENAIIAHLLEVYARGFRVRSFVDLGCGTGLLLDLIKLGNRHYRGVDVSSQMIAQAITKHPVSSQVRYYVDDMFHHTFTVYPNTPHPTLVASLFAIQYTQHALSTLLHFIEEGTPFFFVLAQGETGQEVEEVAGVRREVVVQRHTMQTVHTQLHNVADYHIRGLTPRGDGDIKEIEIYHPDACKYLIVKGIRRTKTAQAVDVPQVQEPVRTVFDQIGEMMDFAITEEYKKYVK